MDNTPRFQDFSLSQALIDSLDRLGYKAPTLVQEKTITAFLEGVDFIALAKTGSGKTAACVIPAAERIDPALPAVQFLVVVPTRELAIQYAMEAQKITAYKKVKVCAVMGGEDMGLQRSQLKHGVHLLVATPGRLIDFIYSREIDLTHVKTLILDEADEMLNLSFLEDIEFIMSCLVQEHQTVLFSATMSPEIERITRQFMKDPLILKLNIEDAVPKLIEHKFVFTRRDEKEKRLISLIHELKPAQSIIFCRSRIEVERVANALRKVFPAVDYLHAGLQQQVRSSIIQKFRKGRITILVATDVASRGLDFSQITHVFIYDLSEDPDTHVHRSGRVGRFDRPGVAVSLVTERDLSLLHPIGKRLQKEIEWLGAPPKASDATSRRPAPFRRKR